VLGRHVERLSACAGRSRTDGVQCWVAVSTETFARELIAAGAGRLPAELEAGSGGTAEARSSSGALPDAETRSAGPGKPAGPPGRPAAGARLPLASPALLGAAADALWPPLRALLARAHGFAPPRVGLMVTLLVLESSVAFLCKIACVQSCEAGFGGCMFLSAQVCAR